MKLKYLNFTIVLFIFLTACNRDREPMLPNVTGRAGEVVIVVNSTVWQAGVNLVFKETLGKDAEVLPQSEPLFDIINIPWPNFTNIFKTHRNLVLISLNESEPDAKMVVKRDAWARPQTIIEIVAPSDTSLKKFIDNQSEKIINHFLIAERNRIIENSTRFVQREIGAQLLKNHQLSLIIPPGYTMYVDSGNWAWITHETPETSQGIFVYYYNYEGGILTGEFLLNKRNEILKRNVPGPTPNSFMTTDRVVQPIFREFFMNEKYFYELRGLWRVENNFMGGPFVSLSTLDEARRRIITVEGYVFAPNTEKRNLLRQVEAIIHTLEF